MAAENKKTSKRSIHFILVTIMLDMMGVGLVIPVMPDVIRRFVSTEHEVNHMFGYFVALYALMQFFASPILGSLSDRYGRRPILLGSLFGASLDYIFMALSTSLPMIFIGRVISGLTGASLTVANSYMADISDESNRSANFGMIGAAFGIGFILGPSLGGVLGQIHSSAPFFAAAILNLLNFAFGFYILPESLDLKNRRSFELSAINPFAQIKKLFHKKNLFIFFFTYALLNLAGLVHPSIWTLYTEHKFSWTSWQVGLSLSFVGLVYGFSQAVLTKKLVPIWGEYKALKIGLFLNAIGFLLFATATEGWMMYVIMLTTCLSALSMPCLQSIMTKQVAADRQGELQGSLVSIASIMSILAPILYSKSFDWAVHSDSIKFAGFPYLIAALIILISWFSIVSFLKHNESKFETN